MNSTLEYRALETILHCLSSLNFHPMDMVICHITALKFMLAPSMPQLFHMTTSLRDAIAIFICIIWFLMFAQWPDCLMMPFSKHILTAKLMLECMLSDHTDRHVLPNVVHMYDFRFGNVLPSPLQCLLSFYKCLLISKTKNEVTSYSFPGYYLFLLKRKVKHFADSSPWWSHFMHLMLSMTVW